MTLLSHPVFEIRVTRAPQDIRAAQRLRYDVFVAELGGDGPLVDHEERLERDAFDEHAAHILLLDTARAADDQVVGVYRVMTAEMAQAAGGFYCEAEYDLTPLYQSDRRLLELGRSCLHPAYRGGAGMLHLWQALAAYVDTHDIAVLFGVASFHGTDVQALSAPLSFLYHKHLAPQALRVRAKGPTAVPMDIQPPDTIDRIAAVREIPALIKAYLRLGGKVAPDAFVDHAFNTVDICMILEKDAIDGLQRAILAKGGAHG